MRANWPGQAEACSSGVAGGRPNIISPTAPTNASAAPASRITSSACASLAVGFQRGQKRCSPYQRNEPVFDSPHIRGVAGEIPREDTIYVICRSGARSARVVLALIEAGWQAVNVGGGMQDWAAAGRPMISDSGSAPTVA